MTRTESKAAAEKIVDRWLNSCSLSMKFIPQDYIRLVEMIAENLYDVTQIGKPNEETFVQELTRRSN